jgi:hypothetical protein
VESPQNTIDCGNLFGFWMSQSLECIGVDGKLREHESKIVVTSIISQSTDSLLLLFRHLWINILSRSNDKLLKVNLLEFKSPIIHSFESFPDHIMHILSFNQSLLLNIKASFIFYFLFDIKESA